MHKQMNRHNGYKHRDIYTKLNTDRKVYEYKRTYRQVDKYATDIHTHIYDKQISMFKNIQTKMNKQMERHNGYRNRDMHTKLNIDRKV